MFSRRFIFMILLVLAIASSASASTFLVVRGYNQISGEILIPIEIQTTDNIGNLQFNLEYVGPCPSLPYRSSDQGVLNATNVIRGSLSEGSLFEWNESIGLTTASSYNRGCRRYINIGIVSSSGINGTGSIAAVRFNITGNANFNNMTYLSLTTRNANRARTFSAINISAIRGVFFVKNDIGDCNGDGRTTSADALLALRMALGKEHPNLEGCDLDRNRVIETIDAARILSMAVEGMAIGVRREVSTP